MSLLQKIKDWHIAAYVGVLVLIDIVTYTIIMGVQKIRPRPILVPNAEREPTKNVRVHDRCITIENHFHSLNNFLHIVMLTNA